jgi:seryl-tRNA synthetase
MSSKEDVIQIVKKWVQLDNETRALQKEIAQRKKQKNELSNNLIEVMKENEIDCFDLKGGQLLYVKKDIKKPINKKNLLEILNRYYEGDLLQASELQEYILSNRETTTKESIVHKIDK